MLTPVRNMTPHRAGMNSRGRRRGRGRLRPLGVAHRVIYGHPRGVAIVPHPGDSGLDIKRQLSHTACSMDTPAARLEKKFKRKHRLVESEIGKTQKAALRQLLKDGRVVRVKAYYLAGCEPTLDSECARIVEKLLSQPRLFRKTALSSKYKEALPFFRAALTKLLDDKQVFRLGLQGGDGADYFIHRDHLLQVLQPEKQPSDDHATQTNRPPKITQRIYQAYERLTRDKGRRSVFISDLQRASKTSWVELSTWIEQEVVERGQGQLDEGDWGAATDEQRAAAVELWGRKRLYIALVS